MPHLEAHLASEPNDWYAHELLIRCHWHFYSWRRDAGWSTWVPLNEWCSGVKSTIRDAVEQFALAEQLVYEDKDERAIGVYESLIENQSHAATHHCLAVALRSLNRTDEARIHEMNAMVCDPHHLPSARALMMECFDSREFHRLLDTWSTVKEQPERYYLERYPDAEAALGGMELIVDAVELLRRTVPRIGSNAHPIDRGATDELYELAKRSPANLYLTWCATAALRDNGRADEICDRWEKDFDSTPATREFAKAYEAGIAGDRYAVAAECLEQIGAVGKGDEPIVLYITAIVRQGLGEFEAAIEFLNRCLATDPMMVGARWCRISIEQRLEVELRSLTEWTIDTETHQYAQCYLPAATYAMSMIAVTAASQLQEASRLDEAISLLDRVSDELKVVDSVLVMKLACLLAAKGDYRRSVGLVKEALQEEDEAAVVLDVPDRVALERLGRGRSDESAVWIDVALALGTAYDGDLTSAEVAIRAILEDYPGHPYVLYHRACLLWSLGKHDEAVVVCEAATTESGHDERLMGLLMSMLKQRDDVNRLLHWANAAQGAEKAQWLNAALDLTVPSGDESATRDIAERLHAVDESNSSAALALGYLSDGMSRASYFEIVVEDGGELDFRKSLAAFYFGDGQFGRSVAHDAVITSTALEGFPAWRMGIARLAISARSE